MSLGSLYFFKFPPRDALYPLYYLEARYFISTCLKIYFVAPLELDSESSRGSMSRLPNPFRFTLRPRMQPALASIPEHLKGHGVPRLLRDVHTRPSFRRRPCAQAAGGLAHVPPHSPAARQKAVAGASRTTYEVSLSPSNSTSSLKKKKIVLHGKTHVR